MRRRLAESVLGLSLFIAAACGGGGNGPSDGVTSAPPPPRPRLSFDVRTEQIVDTSRGAARALPTRIFAPSEGQAGRPYPLVVFAHGSGGLGSGYDVLLGTWASAGYVVAAPQFPAATEEAQQGDWTLDLPNLPGDVSVVITEMLRLGAGTVDPERIGVAGHSMGGMVTLAVAGNTCCRDARIKAVVVLAGRETPFGSGQFWARIVTPVLLVHGDGDRSVTYADGRRAYANAPPPRFLLTIVDGDHGTPYTGDPDNPQARLVTEATLDFFDHYLGGKSSGLVHLQARLAAAPGLAKLEQER